MSSVDVFIPCYNYARYLREAVDSVLSQAGVAVRVLIIDDASKDETADIGMALALADDRVSFRRHRQNAGHIATYNEGIDWVAADYCLLLSADDYLLPGALARATGLMEERPEIGFVFGSALARYDSGALVRWQTMGRVRGSCLVLSSAEFIARAGAANIVPTPTAVVRASLQKAVGGYRPQLPHSGDMEMWLRLAARGSVGYVDTDQAVYRQHATNMSIDYRTALKPDLEQRKLALDMFLESSAHLLADAEAVRRRLAHQLAAEALKGASTAFNKGDAALSQELLDYARTLDPAIPRSAHWWRIALKRRFGAAAWRAISSLAQRSRMLTGN